MALHAYFIDQPNGQTLEFRNTVLRGKVQRAKGVSYDKHGKPQGYVEGHGWTPITRKIEMKPHPSKHECDDRCLNASGRVMKCECSCGGKNHGKGR